MGRHQKSIIIIIINKTSVQVNSFIVRLINKTGVYVHRLAVRIRHGCDNCTDAPVVFSLIVKIEPFSTWCCLSVQARGCLTRGDLQCIYMFRVIFSHCNGVRVIYSYTETVRDISRVFFNFLLPRYRYLRALKLTSPTCLLSERLDAQSGPQAG